MVTRTGQEITGFNGDGFADVLWQTLNSSVVLWEMAGASITGSAQLAGPFGFWSPAVVKRFQWRRSCRHPLEGTRRQRGALGR